MFSTWGFHRVGLDQPSGFFLVAVPLSAALSTRADADLIKVAPDSQADFTTVAAAMAAASAGDTVAVAEGDFECTNVEVSSGVLLSGGWDSSFKTRIPRTSTLVSTGPQALRSTGGQDQSTVVEGFVVTGATRSAFLCTSSNATIRDNEFRDNEAIDGGAIHCEYGASPVIRTRSDSVGRAEGSMSGSLSMAAS